MNNLSFVEDELAFEERHKRIDESNAKAQAAIEADREKRIKREAFVKDDAVAARMVLKSELKREEMLLKAQLEQEKEQRKESRKFEKNKELMQLRLKGIADRDPVESVDVAEGI